MKTLILLVALVCAASGNVPKVRRNDPPTSINQHFIDFLHNERVNFPCGWPDSDIPPLEPHRIAELNMLIDSSSEFTNVDFRMTDALVTGQKHMWIEDLNMSVVQLIMDFEISIESLLIEGDHHTTTNMVNGVITIPISGTGRVTMDCRNAVVTGRGRLRTLPNGNLNMESLISTVRIPNIDARLNGFGALDGTISRLVSLAAPGMIADNQELINESVQATLLPGMNRFLNQHTMVSLVNLMADRNQNPPPRRCFW